MAIFDGYSVRGYTADCSAVYLCEKTIDVGLDDGSCEAIEEKPDDEGIDLRYLFFVVALFWGVTSPGVIEAQDVLSKHEHKVLESGERDSLELVINRLRLLTQLKGKEAVRSVVPALIQKVQALQGAADSVRIAEQELERYMLDLLVRIEDKRTLPVLAEGMVVAGTEVAVGLADLGAVPDVIDSLGSQRVGMAWGAAMALIEVNKRRSALLFKHDRDRIRAHLLIWVQQGGGAKMAFIKALGVFGNVSVLPVLVEVSLQDTFLGPRKTYVNRACANQIIAEIRQNAKR